MAMELKDICVRTDGSGMDWRKIYEDSFPENEREPVEKYLEWFEEGAARLYETTDIDGRTVAFSIIECGSSDTILGAYFAVREDLRSNGIGKQHALRLLEQLKEEFPHGAIFGEIDDRQEPGIDEGEREIREKRARFYAQFGAQWWLGSYLAPDLSDEEEGEAEESEALRFEFIGLNFDGSPIGFQRFKEAAREVLVDCYELPEDHDLVAAIESQEEPVTQELGATTSAQLHEIDVVTEDVKPD